MTHKIAKSTERGQITLPKKWREHFPTNSFIVEMHDDKLIIRPLKLKDHIEEEVLFDADRDNNGKGVSAEDMIAMIQKINNEQN